ncbi:CD209 antigen-like protein E [Carassius carassius]|uniref:CD209 antigen-like protein E n=1 Tax=Carassius carassius TaxID=217509 RepID=UPI0028690016|nr:CD209 antigen-like protein E [Carassius carassius]
MSDAIYEDVIRTESERAEITVDIYESADCVRDHDLRTETNTQQPLQCTGSDSVKIRSSRTAVVCLVLLCVLLLTAVTVLCVHIHTNNTNYTQERDQLLTKINSLTEERNQMLTNIANLSDEREQLLTNNSYHIQLNKQLNQEKNETWKCFNGMDGWLYYKFSFYYISSEMKNWTESRRYCTERGADLIIINNREEQKTVDKMRDGKTGFWIGLTDSEEEGNWKWVDNSTLTSGFWRLGQPGGKTSENCAVSYFMTLVFHDYPCNDSFKWICEKNILERTLKDQDFLII